MTDLVIRGNAAGSNPQQQAIAEAIEAARQAAERARIAAEHARAAANAARLAADKSRKAAEAASHHGDKPAHADATKLKTKAGTDEHNALKLEATANLKDKRSALEKAKLDDAEQGRGAGNPSSTTVTAGEELKTAKETAALYEDHGTGAKPHKESHRDRSPLSQSQKETQALLKKAEAAGKTVFEQKRKGKKPSQAQKDALNHAVGAWLKSAEHDLRTAGVTAQAKGKDPASAMKREARALMDKVESGKVFDADALGEYVDSGPTDAKKGAQDILHSVLAESPERRQLLVEKHDSERTGAEALRIAKTDAKKADHDADAAKKVADTYHGGGYVEDGMQAGAAEKAQFAAEADAKVKALKKAYGADGKVGTIPAEFNVREADLNVTEASRRFEASGSAADGKALDHAIATQKLAHAQRDGLVARQAQHDAKEAQADAQRAYDAAKASQPQPMTVRNNNGGKVRDVIVLPDGYDVTFNATPGSADAKAVHPIDGKWYLAVRTTTGSQKAGDYELNPATAALWAANDKVEAANAEVVGTKARWKQAGQDFDNLTRYEGSADGRTPSTLGTRDEIDDEVTAANKAVSDAQAVVKTRLSEPCSSVAPTDPDSLALGSALQRQSTASARAAAFDAAEALAGAERDLAAGKPVSADLTKLRTVATTTAGAYEDAKQTPDADQERSLRSLQTKWGKDLAAQDKVVAKARTALDGARPGASTKVAKASLATAQDARAKLDLAKRGIDAELAVIDAGHAALAARAEYKLTGFAQPHDEIYKRDGEVTVDKMYPAGYDPTSTVTPGNVPEGVGTPKLGDDGWTVTYKHDVDMHGVTGPMHSKYVVEAGTYRMNPTAAAIWQADRDLGTAVGARDVYRSEVATLTTPTGSDAVPFPSVETADGRKVDPIDFTDDLTTRKTDVDRSVEVATRALAQAEKRQEAGHGDPAALRTTVDDGRRTLDTVTAEQRTITAVMNWQQADRLRLDADADKRAGRLPVASCQDPTQAATDLRARAREARSTWLAKLESGAVDDAQRAVNAARQDHDAWKTQHADRLATESDTKTWKALQAAEAALARSKGTQATMANVAAQGANSDLVATLGPDQRGDGQALAELFLKSPENAKTLSQSLINDSYAKTRGLPVQMSGRIELSNNVAFALGWQPTGPFDVDSPYAAGQIRSQDLFSGLPKAQQEMRTSVSARIAELGGDNARVTTVPVIYAVAGDDGGVVQTAIFKVETRDGGVQYVDEQAHTYDDVDDYRANNALPVEGSLVMPEDGDFSLDSDGNVKLFTGAAHTETFTQEMRRRLHLDVWVGVGGLVAGVALSVGSFGALSVPGAMLIAASAYGIATSVDSLQNQADHGVDVNPFKNTQARMDWLNLGLSAASVPMIGSGARAASLAAAAERAGDAGDEAMAMALKAQAARAARPAEALAMPVAAGSVGAFGEGAYHVVEDWDEMTPSQQDHAVGMLLLNAAGFGSPVYEKGIVEVHAAFKSAVPRAGEPNGTTVRSGHEDEGQTPGTGGHDVAADPAGKSTSIQPVADKPIVVDPADRRPTATEPTAPVVPRDGDGAPVIRLADDRKGAEPAVQAELAALSASVSRNTAATAIGGGEIAEGRPTTARGPNPAGPASEAASPRSPFESTRNPHAGTQRQRPASALTPFRPSLPVGEPARPFSPEVMSLIDLTPTLETALAQVANDGYDVRMGKPGEGSETRIDDRVTTLDPIMVREPTDHVLLLAHETDHASPTRRLFFTDKNGSSTRTAPDAITAEGEARLAEIVVGTEIRQNGGPDIARITKREQAIYDAMRAGSLSADEGVARLAQRFAPVRRSTGAESYGAWAAEGPQRELAFAAPVQTKPATVVLADRWGELQTLLRSGKLTMSGPVNVIHLRGNDAYDVSKALTWLQDATHDPGDQIALAQGKHDWTDGPDPQSLTDRDVFVVSRETYETLQASKYEGIELNIDHPYDLALPVPEALDAKKMHISATVALTGGFGAGIGTILYLARDTSFAALQPLFLIGAVAYRQAMGGRITNLQHFVKTHAEAVRVGFGELDALPGVPNDAKFEEATRRSLIKKDLDALERKLVKHAGWRGIQPEVRESYVLALNNLRSPATSPRDRNLAIDVLKQASDSLMSPDTWFYKVDNVAHIATLAFSNGAILESWFVHPQTFGGKLSVAASVFFLASNGANSSRRVIVPVIRLAKDALIARHPGLPLAKKAGGWLDTAGYATVAASSYNTGHPVIGSLATVSGLVAGYKALHNYDVKWLDRNGAKRALIVGGRIALVTTTGYLVGRYLEQQDEPDRTKTSAPPTLTPTPTSQTPTTQTPTTQTPTPTPTTQTPSRPNQPNQPNQPKQPGQPNQPNQPSPPNEPGQPRKSGEPKLAEPRQPPKAVKVAAGSRATSTLWGIAEANASALLTKHEFESARKRGGHNAVTLSAFKELLQLNPRFRPELLDGVPTSKKGDPDTVQPGRAIVLERL